MPVPRFEPQVTTDFRNIPTFNPHEADAAAGVFQDMSRVFAETNQIVSNIQANHVQVDSARAGEAYGQNIQNYDEKELPEGYTLADQTFRQAAMQSNQDAVRSYLSNLEADRENNFLKIQSGYEALPDEQKDPNKLAADLDNYVTKTAGAMPGELGPQWAKIAGSKAMPIVTRANASWTSYRNKQATADNAALVVNLQNQLLQNPAPQNTAEQKAYDTSLAQLKQAWDAQGLTPNEKIEKQQAFLNNLNAAAHIATFAKISDIEKQMQFINQFSHEKPQNLGLDLAKQSELINTMQAHVGDQQWYAKQHEQGLSFNQAFNIQMAKNDIEDRASKGNATESEINALVKNTPSLQDAEGGRWAANTIGKLREARNKQSSDDSRIAMTLSGHIPADQSSEETHRIVDKAYENAIGGVQPLAGNPSKTGAFGEQRPGHIHDGIDLAAAQGTAITSMRSGRVIAVGAKGGYGQVIEVLQDDGKTALYAHTSSQNVKKGDLVAPGQVIGKVGMTGHASGPHLHLRIKDEQGHLVDPDTYRQQLANTSRPANHDAFVHQLITTTGYVPKKYKEEMVQLLHGTSQQQAEAGTRYGWLMDKGIEVSGLSDADRGKLNAIDAELRNGKTGQQAVESAALTTDRNYLSQLNANEHTVRNLLKKEENQPKSAFPATGGGWLGFGATAPEVPTLQGFQASLNNDWKRIFSNAYSNSGNEVAARNEATRQIKKLYGTSSVNGRPTVMRYPPEKFYGLTGYNDEQNASWMKKQLDNDLKGKFLVPVNTGNVYLVSDAITARQPRPDYQLWQKNKAGLFEPLYSQNGKIMRWHPDSNGEVNRLHADAVAKNKQAIQNARSERQSKVNTPKVDSQTLYQSFLGGR